MSRAHRSPTILAVAATAFLSTGAVAQQAEEDAVRTGPTVDIGAYLRDGLKNEDTLADNPRYPAITNRNDPNNNSAFFGRFGGEPHRNRASKRPGIFSIFGFR